ncbi:MAG: hypothetical protein KGJ62_13725 [Armatimonadetes bacterium]|nr:hypothetical protein [Armatimonadota bacterium]
MTSPDLDVGKKATPIGPDIHDPGYCMRLYDECEGRVKNPPDYCLIPIPWTHIGNCRDWAKRMMIGARPPRSR